MNLQQIEAVCAIARADLNISAAAEILHRSQPTLSRQVQDFESELGVRIFARTRNKLVALTPKGEEILRVGQRIVRDVRSLTQIGRFELADSAGEVKIATTHLHARYSLPRVMKIFAERFPGVLLTLQQGDPIQCCKLVATGEADIGVTTMGEKIDDGIVAIPAFKLSRCVIVPRGHPLVRDKTLTLKKLAEYPIVAYSTPFKVRGIIDAAFARARLRPRVVCNAIDSDVAKTYVESGMGIAVLARIAFDPVRDHNLVAMDANHLFEPGILHLVFRKHSYQSRHAHEFVSLFAPHVSADLIRSSMDGAEFDRVRLSHEAPVAAFA